MAARDDILLRVKDRLFGMEGTVDKDEELLRFIDDYIELVEKWTARKADSTVITGELLDGTGHYVLYPRWGPITSVQNLWVDETREFGSESLLTEGADQDFIVVNEPGYILRLDERFPNKAACIKIDYTTSGWSKDLYRAVVELVVIDVHRKTANLDPHITMITAGASTIIAGMKGIPEEILAIIEINRRFVMPMGRTVEVR